MTHFKAPKGTYDLLPPDSRGVLAVRAGAGRAAAHAGYGYVETPVFEDTALFERGVGESTDVVSKEMYTFADPRRRPTSPCGPRAPRGVVRAAVPSTGARRPAAGQAVVLRLVLPLRAPAGRPLPPLLPGRRRGARRRRPGAGRRADRARPMRAYAALGLTQVRLLLTRWAAASAGRSTAAALQEFLRGLDLDDETRSAGSTMNPLRVLDDKRPEVQAQLAERAGGRATTWATPARRTTTQVRALLRRRSASTWEEAPTAGRAGLDYYTRTTFEFAARRARRADRGRRRRPLRRAVRDDRRPADCPASAGRSASTAPCSRCAPRASSSPAPPSGASVYAVPLGAAATKSARLVHRVVDALRRRGISADIAYGDRGLKGAMKAADRSGAATPSGRSASATSPTASCRSRTWPRQSRSRSRSGTTLDRATSRRGCSSDPHPRRRDTAPRARRHEVVLAGWVATPSRPRRRHVRRPARRQPARAGGLREDVAGAHDLRSEWCVKVIGEVAQRPRGQREPRAAHRRDRGRRHRRRGAERVGDAAVPDRGSDAIESGVDEVVAVALPLPRPAPRRARRARCGRARRSSR